MDELTPMMRQYRAMKQTLDKDVLLLFRVGDFYEIFMEDARIAAPLLGILLTKRGGQPLCGIPYHALDQYLAKLLKLGRKVAICDQMEDPKLCRGKMVRRDITRNDIAHAREMLLFTSASLCLSLTSFDGAPVGDGRPGPVASRLREDVLRIMLSEGTSF